jgi:hypothetical protein
MTSSSRFLGAACALALATTISSVVVAGNPSAEDFATARALYKEGKDLRASGDLKGALEKLTAAHSLGRTPLTGIELARTQVQLGLLVEARETCLGIGRLAVEPDETARSADARKDAAKLAEDLRPRIASLRVHVSPGALVTIDGVQVPAVALGEARFVNPGHHVITAHVEGGATVSSTTDVAEGQTGEVSLSPPSAPIVVDQPKDTVHVEPPATAKPEKQQGLGALIIAGISVTGAGLALGAIGGVVALFGKSDLDGSCPNGQCSQSSFSALDSARTAALASTIGFSVAGGGLVLLVIGLVTHTSPKESMRGLRILPDLGLNHVGLTGAF